MFNQKSTPKKMQNYSDDIDKRVSIDIIYSELQDLKNNMNKSYDCSNKLDQIERVLKTKEETINELVEKVNQNMQQFKMSESRMNQEYVKLREEIDIHKNMSRGIKNDYVTLSNKVDQLTVDFESLKHWRTQNNTEDIIKRHLTTSYEDVKFSMDQHMNKINSIFSESMSLSVIPEIEKFETASLIKPNHKQEITNSLDLSEKSDIPEVVQPVPIKESQVELTTKSSLSKDLKLQTGLVGLDINNPPAPTFGANKSITSQEPAVVFGVNKSSTAEKHTTIFSGNIKNTQEPPVVFGTNKMNNGSLFGGVNKSSSISFGVPKSSDLKSESNVFNTNANTKEPLTDLKSQSTNLFAQPVSNNSGTIFGSKPTNIFGGSVKTTQPMFGSNTQPIKIVDTNNSKETSVNLFGGLLKSRAKVEESQPNKPNLFGGLLKTQPNVEESQPNKPNLFGGLLKTQPNVEESQPNKPNFPTALYSDIPSFSSLSKTASDSFGFGNSESTEMKSESTWKSGSKLFTSKPNTSEANEENSEQNLEEEHDPHFQPIIDLPPLVSISKDEDSHDVLFRSRCKLYRFINNEWKERGVGEMKIMQTKESVDQSQPVKLLMRRDQVRKICCNQRVSKNVPAFAEMPNEKSTCWVGNDFSEGEPVQEKFAARFSHVDELNQFKRIVEQIQSKMSTVEKTD